MQVARTRRFPILLLFVALLFPGAGCAELDLGGSLAPETGPAEAAAAAAPEPYYPTDFKDIMVPAELTWNREKSMSIRTSSFAGGILNFSGRVDINSLTDFFAASMQKDGWKLSGSIKYKNVLLAFTKPQKTSLISIYQSEFGYKTEVNIYVTEDVTGSSAFVSGGGDFR